MLIGYEWLTNDEPVEMRGGKWLILTMGEA